MSNKISTPTESSLSDGEKGGNPAIPLLPSRVTSFEGPLPPPEILSQYERILPGMAERVIHMAEEEQRVRHEAVRNDDARKGELVNMANEEVAMKKRGQIIGLSVIFICVVLAFVAAIIGIEKWWAFLLVPTASLIASFMPGLSFGTKKTKNQ